MTTVAQAKQVARNYLAEVDIDSALLRFGLPEVDDRYHIWRVPLVSGPADERIGEIVIGREDQPRAARPLDGHGPAG